MRDLLLTLLPPVAEVVVWAGEEVLPLDPDEAAAVARAIPSRRSEFAKGRWCAHRALDRLGAPNGPLLVGPGRAPTWPAGFVGSITHAGDTVAAAATPSPPVAGIGIDVERSERLDPEVAALVLNAEEKASSAQHGAETGVLVFSAKEAVHKAVYPLSGVWMDFLDVEVTLDPPTGSFHVRPIGEAALPVSHLFEAATGRFGMTADQVVTTFVVPSLALDAAEHVG